ncbi:hypothetical protein VKT23_011068 [Stygiomarasmius scandens]|uniref:Uncharacterized protein n=1 Tax=Marasmiellus scandens TaxID=2682957 RepID=A0ABR1JDW6_9AGAR
MATHHHTQYVHYTPPGTHTSPPTSITPSLLNGNPTTSTAPSSSAAPVVTTVAPQDTTYIHPHRPRTTVQPQPQQTPQPQPPAPAPPQQSAAQPESPSPVAGSSQGPLIATGDWTKDLVHLAKTAELKKHALQLQLHTAHILSAHATLEQKSKSIQDVKEQKNKLDSERNRLLNSLRQVNEDRDKADMLESSLEKECTDLRTKISSLSGSDYAVAKRDVDRLRQELGQPPLPSLQNMLDEKNAQYLNERRLNGQSPPITSTPASSIPTTTITTSTSFSIPITPATHKRSATEDPSATPPIGKRPRGRPKGSKNKKSEDGAGAQGTM